MALEVPGGASAYFRNVALMLHLLDDQAEGVALKNFIELIDRKPICAGPDGKVIQWIEDYLRAFKGNPGEFVNCPPLASLTDQQKAFLKQVLSDPDPGDVWKLDDPPWINAEEPPIPHNYWTRGIIGEILLYQQKYRALGYTHLPIEKAIDYTGAAAVQVKMVKNPSGAVNAMKTAIRNLLAEAPEGPVRLHVLHKPGTDGIVLREALEAYRDNLLDEDDAVRLLIEVEEYSTKF